jgi:hypothetical protein
MDTLTAEQKIRQQLAGSPVKEPHFQHEGPDVVRWITGGTLPDMHVMFHQQGNRVEVKCATCETIIGYLPVDSEATDIVARLAAMRLSGHDH